MCRFVIMRMGLCSFVDLYNFRIVDAYLGSCG